MLVHMGVWEYEIMAIDISELRIRYIKTKKNKIRKIISYESEHCFLRKEHQKIQQFLEERFMPSIFAKGYIKHRSIYDNAKAHMYNDYFLLLDIKDFFPNILHKQLVEKIFHEINLKNENQITQGECVDIVKKCSVNARGLPLGFITSPILSNIYLKEFDGLLYNRLKKLGLQNLIYTRYVDDLTISFRGELGKELKDVEKDIVEMINDLLKRYGLKLKDRKTRMYSLDISNHVKVTGINITKDHKGKRTLTIGKKTKNQLFWRALKCFDQKNVEEIQSIKGMQSFILSIEKNGYENVYSKNMLELIKNRGFSSLKELIDSL